MASAFATQLRQIATTSTNELDLKAQKAGHSQSLIFEKKVAGSQDFDTIYQICCEGFQELCQLDQRFIDFQRNIFNAQSKDQDRSQMTGQENEALDSVLEHFLSLVAGRVLLRPAVKALEWLIRRFKVHIYNTSYLIFTFLPYHEIPIFQNLLSILPVDLPVQYRFLAPYLKSATNPPRNAIAYSAINSDPFFDAFCSYTLETCRRDASYPTLLTFWTSIVTEAVAGRITAAQSARKEVQQQRQHDVLLKVLPILNDGLSIQNNPELTLACYTIIVVLANKTNLADDTIDAFMEGVAISLTTRELYSGLVCLCILAERKTTQVASKKLLSSLIQRSDLVEGLRSVDESYSASGLVAALACRGIQNLKKKNYADRLRFVSVLTDCVQWRSEHATNFLREILQIMTRETDSDSVGSAIKARLLDILQHLSLLEQFAKPLRQSAREFDTTDGDLGLLLGDVGSPTDATIQIPPDDAVEVGIVSKREDALEIAFKNIPARTVNQLTFLTSTDLPLFQQLSDAYQTSCRHSDGATRFQALPIWEDDVKESSFLFVSFLIRIACGPYLEHCRRAALKALVGKIEAHAQVLDSQALLCYVVSCLADPASTVRRAASEVLIAMNNKAPQNNHDEGDFQRWGADDLYDQDKMSLVKWLPASDLTQMLQQGFLPRLEECVADATHIAQVVEKLITGTHHLTNGGNQRGVTAMKELKRAIRHGLFESFVSHIIATPLMATKIELMKLLSKVEKVGAVTKAKALYSTVQQWALLSVEEATATAKREQLAISNVDSGIVNIANPSDKDAGTIMLNLVTEMKYPPRPSFINSVFAIVTDMWPKMSPDARSTGAQKLIDLSLSASVYSERARELLATVELPAEALSRVLYAAFSVVSNATDAATSRKRRRSSSGTKPAVSGLNSMASQMTLALELIDSSKPESHPELLAGLFEALNVLQKLKFQSKRDLPYLFNLCLGSMLAIVGGFGPSTKIKKDLATARVELVTDCIGQSSSPQVQNTAILLSAELARIVPEKILHHAMPIFTFLGTNALVKDDEHSEFVVNRAIDAIVPPLMEALQSERKNAVAAVSDLLSSFSAAFEHVARQRRLGLFQRLVLKLGTDGILNTLIAMLLARHPNNSDASVFVMDLMRTFTADVRLQTVHNLLEQVLQINQGNIEIIKLITASEVVDRDTIALNLRMLLAATGRIMNVTKLENRSKNSFKHSKDAIKVPDSQTLGILRSLMQSARVFVEDESLSSAVDECIESLLDILPISESTKLIAHILNSDESSWHHEVIMMLERLLSGPAVADTGSCNAIVDLLQTLMRLINEDEHDRVKHGALRCIDRITELYGRREVARIVEIASSLASSGAINAEKPGLQTTTLLCLASMVDCAKDAIIPLVPQFMSVAVSVLRQSLVEEAEDGRLHDAAYALISALISHVSYVLSEEDLDNVLKLSAEAANASLSQQHQSTRQDTLLHLARTIDLKLVVASIHRTWTTAVENDVDAAVQVLEILSISIKHGSRMTVRNVAISISGLFIEMLDLRRVQLQHRDEESYTPDEVASIEDRINQVAIDFIYKLNDATFRPLLAEWVEWATTCPGISPVQLSLAKLHRQTAIFGFMGYLFRTLKSIVTSYATFIFEVAIEVLRSSETLLGVTPASKSSLDDDVKLLWITACDMLAEACRHDQDSFFASPSRFSSLSASLISQLQIASEKTFQEEIQQHIIPTLVALASATVDIASAHQDLNHHLCQLRHAESAGVRMCSIQVQHALIASDDVGAEWVSHVVQGGGEIMVYVNEMLEDDDEDVEREVRRWVRRVREMVGEDMFEA